MLLKHMGGVALSVELEYNLPHHHMKFDVVKD